jgi:hypothetical protein
MAELNFKENAKAIFDKSVSATPLPFRGTVKNGLTKLLVENFGEDGEITEERVVQMIKENTPKLFLAKGMKAIAPLVSDQSLVKL